MQVPSVDGETVRHQRASNGPTHDGPFYDLSTTVFPVPGARPGGVNPNVTIDSLSPSEISRHQRSHNGPTPDDPYFNLRYQAFPVPGGRPARVTRGVPEGLPRSDEPPYADVGKGSTSTRAIPASKSIAGDGKDEDPVSVFLATLPQPSDGPLRQAMWTELIQLKTKSLELQIAEARAKERTAELELVRLRQAAARVPLSTPSTMSPPAQTMNNSSNRHTDSAVAVATAGLQQAFGTFPLVTHARSPVIEASSATFTDSLNSLSSLPQMANLNDMTALPVTSSLGSGSMNAGGMTSGVSSGAMGPGTMSSGTLAAAPTPMVAPQMPMTPFDLEAMLQDHNLDNLFSWLPDFGDSVPSAIPLQTAAPSDLLVPATDPTLLTMPTSSSGGVDMATVLSTGANTTAPDSGQTLTSPTPGSPHIKRQNSPDSDTSPQAPPPKRGKTRGEKKIVLEQSAACTTCGRNIARVLLRAPRSSIPAPVLVEFRCPDCSGIHQPPTFDPSGTTGASSIGSMETRKRMRAAMEDDDLFADDSQTRRCFCDVCQRVVAVGQVVGGVQRYTLGHIAEIVCVSCDSKYQRCTDCGGGGGPRVGIGKWRLRQVFQPGRKTCSLSHSRLGDRPREIGVHVTPTEFTPEQLKEVISRCKTLWNEKTLSRLAVPEMLEIDLPPHLINPLRNYHDIDDIVTRNWPSREGMIRAEDTDPSRFKRLLGLTWAHSRPRRTVRTVDIEEEYARVAEHDDDDDMSTVLANVKRTNVVIPPGSELIGMWGGEWDMQHGSLLISTFIPFEGTDGEDSTALSVGELITKVQSLRQQINAERTAVAAKTGAEPDLLPQCEHLWVVSGGSMPLIRERMADILVRKRSFVHVEEYLTRHPDFIHALQARPVGLHPDLHRALPHQVDDDPDYKPAQPLVLVRWLGKDFDAQKILEIKQMEFGGKTKGKLKKMPKSRV